MSYPLSASLRWIYGYEIAACAQRGMELRGREKKEKKNGQSLAGVKRVTRHWTESAAASVLSIP